MAALPLSARAGDVARLLPGAHEEWQDVAEAILDVNRMAAIEAADPLQAGMKLCEEPGCTQTGWQTLTAEEGERLRGLFASETDAAGERERIGKAIALLETIVGARNGTWRDHPANERQADHETGQLDCISESVNTQTYLDRLHRAGLLHHHRLGGFIHRYTVVLQHVAVDMVELATEERFAVDSWVGANGDLPEIRPYGDWRWEWGV